jgi:hypothetical protein
LQKGSKNLVDAAHGTGTAADAYDALGITVRDTSKTMEQVMLEVADKFAGMEDGAQKTAFAMDIFGKGGAAMIPFLNQGSAAIAAQRKEAELLGATWTTAQAQQAEAFNDNLTRIETGLTGFRNAFVSGLLPFINEAVSGIVEKIKEWSASGDLQQWAKNTSDFVINAIVAIAQFIDAHLVGAVEGGSKAFTAMEIAARGLANGVLVITNGILALVWAVNAGGLGLRKMLGIQESLGVSTEEVEKRVDRLSATMAENSQQIIEMSQSINDAMGRFQTPLSEEARGRLSKLAEGVSEVALKIQGWAEKAKAGGSEAVKAVSDGVAKTGQKILESAKEQVKKLDETFQALKLRGEVSLQDTLDWMQKRAALFRAGSAERMQAEAETQKYIQEMADRIFQHEQTLGMKSLQDAIDRERQKAAAAKDGSEAQMKAQETLYQKEQELAEKRRGAAPDILEKIKRYATEQGYDTERFTPADLARWSAEMRYRESQQMAPGQEFTRGIPTSFDALGQNLKDAAQRANEQKLFQQLGTPEDIIRGALAPPTTPGAGGLGTQLGSPAAGMAENTTTAMEAAYDALDKGLTKMEDRTTFSTSKIGQAMLQNIEDWFVRRLMDQAARS